jgi:hypothetical protein
MTITQLNNKLTSSLKKFIKTEKFVDSGEPALKWSENKIKQINGNTSLTIHDRFAAVIKFISNDTNRS